MNESKNGSSKVPGMMRSYAGRKAHAISSVKDKGLSLGALSTFAAILAPFLGYLLAYGWRSGEAQYYGISSNFITVSLEDGLRFAVPLVLAFLCFIVIMIVDSKTGNAHLKKSRVVVASAFFVFMCIGLYIVVQFSEILGEFFWNVAVLVTFGLVLAFCISALGMMLEKKRSVVAVTLVAFFLLLSVSYARPLILAGSLFANTFILLPFLVQLRADTIKKIAGRQVMIYAAVGAIFVAFAYFASVLIGYNSARTSERITLPSHEVVLVTYGGDRSIVGMVEDKHVSKYRVVNLSDEGPWVVENDELEGYPLLPF